MPFEPPRQLVVVLAHPRYLSLPWYVTRSDEAATPDVTGSPSAMTNLVLVTGGTGRLVTARPHFAYTVRRNEPNGRNELIDGMTR
ncbi:hypothetical protein GCM10022255_076190 [Dactylosporangium darangshiense]|uniref:Uncharacterized protein n=1 Tax=Dactylosporangium darangshiense TaxID=579108 RepID=A0ABP8DJV9_9ACTN